ncbi:MAG TPA: alpha/beta hydrolase [Candidatus Nanopelagicales bacterium]
MTSTTFTLESPDGTGLHATWSAPESPKATIVLVHGLGEHSGRHAHVAARLNEAGYAVEQFDLRGHGRSPGARGDTRFAPTMDDIEAALDDAETRVPGVPRFIYGHSLGGLLTLTYVLRRRPQLDGVVCSSAGLRSPVLEQRLKMTAAKLLGSVLPSVPIPTGLDDNGLSRDPEVVQAYRADPLVHDKGSLALGKDGAVGADWALANAERFDLPLLMFHGSADPITYARGTQEFASKVRGDVTVRIYDGLYHECHNEPEQAQVLDDVVAWLDAHCG